jgi:heptosyltransferase-2
MKIETSCRHYRGEIPCAPNKKRGKECPTCDEFSPIGRRVLVIKLGAPGDVLRTTALLPAMKKAWPDSEITWVTRASARDLLLNLPQIDRLLTLEDEGALGLLGERFDLLLNLDNDSVASSLATQIQAGEKRGFVLNEQGRIVEANPEARPWLEMALFDRIKKENSLSYQEHMRRIAGLEFFPRDRVQVALGEEEETRAGQVLAHLGLAGHSPIAFNTGSGDRWKTKRWSPQYFVELALALAEEAKDPIVLLGGPVEDEANTLLVTERPDRFVYPGVLPIRVFMAVVSKCRLLVTADTLALHVGIGTGVRTIGLFGPTSVVEIEQEPNLLKIQAPVECVCCYLKSCDKQPFCMDEITVPVVLKTLQAVSWLPLSAEKPE